jgi:hypothetical protein
MPLPAGQFMVPPPGQPARPAALVRLVPAAGISTRLRAGFLIQNRSRAHARAQGCRNSGREATGRDLYFCLFNSGTALASGPLAHDAV